MWQCSHIRLWPIFRCHICLTKLKIKEDFFVRSKLLTIIIYPDYKYIYIYIYIYILWYSLHNFNSVLYWLYLMIACSETHFNIDSNKIDNCRLSVYFSFQIMNVFLEFAMFNSTVGQDNLYLLLPEIRAETSNN